MAGSETTVLKVKTREVGGSRDVRRLRRSGQVPGVIYGGDAEPQHIFVEAKVLRNTLAHAHAVIEVQTDSGKAIPTVVKDVQRHPVKSNYVHFDLMRVNMSKPITALVTLELIGGEKAVGVVAGGVLSHEAHQVEIEALPGDIPDSIQYDVSALELNTSVTLADVTPPSGVRFTEEDTVVATITPPSVEEAAEEVEQETEVVGEEAAESA